MRRFWTDAPEQLRRDVATLAAVIHDGQPTYGVWDVDKMADGAVVTTKRLRPYRPRRRLRAPDLAAGRA